MIIYFLIGLVVGAVVAFWAARSKNNAIIAAKDALIEREKETQARDRLKYENSLSEERKIAAEQMRFAIQQAQNQRDKDMANIKQDYAQQIESLRKRSDEQIANLKEIYDQQIASLKKSYDDQMALFKAEVTTSTAELLKSRSGELQQSNTARMEELFRPIKENISKMEQSINESRESHARQSASFEKSIQQMMETNEKLGSQADRLSSALQRKSKVAGNWGELILSELLESQGLIEGEHFDVQRSMKDDDTGARKIPDVVLHLADDRDVVIDSKMSLTAFIDYQNAELEDERKDALQRHIQSVRNHVRELVAKKYQDCIKAPKRSIDFVIMFVPIEGALQLAMAECPHLWREAFEKKVFIAGGQTLVAALRIIDLTWVNVKQNRNTEDIMDQARNLIDRVCIFYESFQKLGKTLQGALNDYNEVSKKVEGTPQSIVATGKRIENLGARGKKRTLLDVG